MEDLTASITKFAGISPKMTCLPQYWTVCINFAGAGASPKQDIKFDQLIKVY
jgi:hypothetical protein